MHSPSYKIKKRAPSEDSICLHNYYEYTSIQMQTFTSKNWKFSDKKLIFSFMFLFKTDIVGTL